VGAITALYGAIKIKHLKTGLQNIGKGLLMTGKHVGRNCWVNFTPQVHKKLFMEIMILFKYLKNQSIELFSKYRRRSTEIGQGREPTSLTIYARVSGRRGKIDKHHIL